MSEPLLVRISRDGKELGTYPSEEVVRLRIDGTLKETDFYWHEGMTEWAPLTQFLAAEARRQAAEKALKEKQEETERAERLAAEKAKAKQQDDRAVAEAVRVRMGKEKEKHFRCNCCWFSFKEPKDPAKDFSSGIWGLLASALLMLIPVIGWIIGGILAIYCACIILASHLVSPYCPACRSSNFSRPEKPDEQK
jgi:hypothetical protein